MVAASPSIRPSARRAGTALGVALALALAAPAAAFADDSDDSRDDRRNEQGATHGQDDRSKDKPKDGRENESSHKGKGESSDKGRSGKDPRGNNGTVKIDGEAFDDGRGNEPHVGCTFQVDFYGFDAGDTATITFTGHAPTGGGLLHSESRTISNDAAGGGKDRDATFTYSVDQQLSELRSVTPHPKQGWHVKLAVDVDSAPGGAKQKVFWINCPQAAAPGGAAPTTTGTTPTTSTGTTTGSSPTTGTGTTPTSGTTSGTAVGAAVPVVGQGALPATVVTGTTVAAAERQDALTLGAAGATLAARNGSTSAQGAVAPAALPFTGVQGLLALLALGLSAVGVGALAHRMGRRTTSPTT